MNLKGNRTAGAAGRALYTYLRSVALTTRFKPEIPGGSLGSEPEALSSR